MVKLLTVKQVAALTGWSVHTVYQKAWRREIPFIKLGRSIRFKEEEIMKLIENSEMPRRLPIEQAA